MYLFKKSGVFAALAIIAFAPLSLAAQASMLLTYTFNSPGTLYQVPSAAESTSPYWWLVEGGSLVISGGAGVATSPGSFVMLARTPVENASVAASFDRVADDFASAANREAYDGEELVARYQDAGDYYYAGIRDDGTVVIKKKSGGVYTTLASAPLFAGVYNPITHPDLIPRGTWIGLKLTVTSTTSGVDLSLYTDVGDTGAWKLAASAVDASKPILDTGLAGVESDAAQTKFASFTLADAPSVAGAPSYDAAVLADQPALYLSMNSPATGVERDLSGHGLNGTYEGGTPALATLPDGESAADFNGAGEYLTVPSSPTLSVSTTGALTWEGWVRPDTFNFPSQNDEGYVDWMGKCEDYDPGCEWEARIYGSSTLQGRPDRLSAYVFNSSAGLGSSADWQPATSLAAGQWLYVVAEYQTTTTPAGCSASDPGSINIWVNGVKQDFAAHAPTGCMSQYSVTPTASDSPLNIGTMALDTWFKGAVGKVAVYDHLLSQAQISAHYQAMTGALPSGSCGATCTIPIPTP